MTLASVRDDTGSRVGISVIARDVSARVRERRELKEATDRLELLVEELKVRTAQAEAASQAKTDFLAALSHELRTPLQAIIGYASLLEERIAGPVTVEQHQQLRRIHGSAAHLLSLIERLLDISRREESPSEVEHLPLDLTAVAAEAAEVIQAEAEAKRLALIMPEAPDERLQHLWGDPVRVRQVLLNLLSNAVRFTERGSVRLELEIGRVAGELEARIRVIDSGIGMGPDEIERVFDPFVQIRPPSGDRTSGLGLGLAISRRLAEAMGGRLDVRSERGSGAEFTLVLPVEEDADHGEGDPEPSSEP